MGGKTYQARYDASPNRTFEAARRAISSQGYSVLHSDQASWLISFNTGRSMSSWNGQDLSASFFADGTGTRVVVGGSLAKQNNPFGGGQAFAWGEKGRLAEQFLAQLRSVLPTIPETATAPVAGAGGVTAELAQLAQMREAGHLTDAEFQAAKRRLLDG